ncbi:fibrous sheath CABYR-binding protein-like isoform X2 [Neocloeon triangulifer]|uniref:fibrous sheath CABYR-binding protein-like isoform X2 n=1 Tax=Neocloeon triangulifer TaxID=2078957 RepID=UPI00286F6D53|nr:fibrous sheath CABYR-binding protein-like isoform X2 [Neocloeon triangulifer]
MADEEVALINEQASQLLSEPQPTPAEPPADPAPEPAAPAPEPIPAEAAPAVAECEAAKVQVAPEPPMFQPIVASPVPIQAAVVPSPLLTNGHTNGHFNGLPAEPSPVPISSNLEITLNKEEGQSWGLRLSGGREFGLPLSVIKLQFGGLAEKQGIRVGDTVQEINGMSTVELSHNEALEVIKKAGNKCLFSLVRSEAATGKMMRPYKPMVQLEDLTVAQPSGARPALSTPVVAAATMRNVALGTLNTEQAESCFTEEVIAETMSAHAEVVVGTALGVNFHKFEPRFEHLERSGTYQLLLEEEQKKGKTMTLPKVLKPQIIPKKQPPKPRTPVPPPKEPTPPPKEPTPPPKEPTPPPKEPTPPPKEPTPPPREPTPLPPKEPTPEPVAVEEPQQPKQEEPPVQNGTVEPVAEQPQTNGVHGDDPELVAIEKAVQQPAPPPPPSNQFFQQQHQLSKKQKELLEYQLHHKMHLEECRRRINKAQKTIYAPTITPPKLEEDQFGRVFELPKAGSRYRPSLPLTPIAFLGNAFPTKEEAFKPFEVKPAPIFHPAPGPKPQAKPACAVQCVIPMKWHPPSKLINGLPYKQTPTVHQPGSKDGGDQEFLPPAQDSKPEPHREPQKPVAHPLQPVPEPPYRFSLLVLNDQPPQPSPSGPAL